MNNRQEASPIKLPATKILFDKVFSAALFLVLLPVALIIALAIKLEGIKDAGSRGPVFHHETRVSAGRPFRLYKFRILKVRALEEEMLIKGERPKAVENRPENLTRTGRILKKFGFDEMPQFWNVLKGDLSLVGPRPKPVPEYEEEIAQGIYRRKIIRAGLTGPVQIMKGTTRTYEDEVRSDSRYIDLIKSAPFWKINLEDFRIIFATLLVIFKGTGE